MPPDVPAEEENQIPVAVLPRPLLRQLGNQRVDALLLLGWIVVDEVVEAGAVLLGRGDGGLFVGGEARRRGQRVGDEQPAVFRRLRRLGGRRSPRRLRPGWGHRAEQCEDGYQGKQQGKRSRNCHGDLREIGSVRTPEGEWGSELSRRRPCWQ